MNKIKALAAAMFFLALTSGCYAQWGAGVSINLKNDQPEKGIGFVITRNLPFQFPVAGIKLRFDANYFKEKVGRNNFIERNLHLSAMGIFYTGLLQPYIGVGAGFGYLTTPDVDTYTFIGSFTGGVQFEVIKPLYPFIEIRGVNYSIPLDKGTTDAKSFQLIGAVGLKFEI